MSSRRRLVAFISLVAALSGFLASCGDEDSSSKPPGTTRPTATTTTTSSSSTTTSTEPVATVPVSVYFVREEKMGPVRRQVEGPGTGLAAMQQLVAGPGPDESSAGLTSAIPAGTKVLGVDIIGGTATVDLSSEFASGGGSLSMQLRVAQVVFTLTQFPTVERVEFALDGAPLKVLGGEGIMLDRPQVRSDWESMTPALLVESPLPGEKVTNPFRVRGTGNTFEASFIITVTDATGASIYEEPAMATSGTGTRGTFDVSVPLPAGTSGALTLKVWESSAKDGSPINVVSFPITL